MSDYEEELLDTVEYDDDDFVDDAFELQTLTTLPIVAIFPAFLARDKIPKSKPIKNLECSALINRLFLGLNIPFFLFCIALETHPSIA